MGPDEPSLALANQLREELGEFGSISYGMRPLRWAVTVKWRNCTRHGFLEGVNDRVFDLEKVIADAVYWHPDFKGSSSIKYVLPVMLPAYSYTKLNIQHGGQATVAWRHLRHAHTCRRPGGDPLRSAGLLPPGQPGNVEIYRRLRSLAGMDPA